MRIRCSSMAATEPSARPEAPPAQAAAPRPTHEPGNYWLSSLELRRGVDVEVLGVRHVPGEALREFVRMHRAWEAQTGSGGAGATWALDITFEADGSVTIPGDLRAA
jgi:hypothetical protein